MNIKVALVDDFAPIRESLAAILSGTPGFECVAASGTAEDALKKFPAKKPDVILMDINLPGMDGIECVARLRVGLPKAQIIMLTIDEENDRVIRSLEAGASGYLVKNLAPARILEAIEEAHRGGAPMSGQVARMLVRIFQSRGLSRQAEENLTPREQEILALLATGFRTKEIADSLGISPATVQCHLTNVYEKLHVRSRSEAVARYLSSRQRIDLSE